MTKETVSSKILVFKFVWLNLSTVTLQTTVQYYSSTVLVYNLEKLQQNKNRFCFEKLI